MDNSNVLVRGNRQVNEEKPPPRVCPRCSSDNTKFCFYNNYRVTQPRYNCRNCRRFWTHGGALRDVPIGGRARKIKRIEQPSVSQVVPDEIQQVNHHNLSHMFKKQPSFLNHLVVLIPPLLLGTISVLCLKLMVIWCFQLEVFHRWISLMDCFTKVITVLDSIILLVIIWWINQLVDMLITITVTAWTKRIQTCQTRASPTPWSWTIMPALVKEEDIQALITWSTTTTTSLCLDPPIIRRSMVLES